MSDYGTELPVMTALTPHEARATVYALLSSIAGTDPTDADTWHGGLGADECEHCTALVKIRHGLYAGEIRDVLRP